METNNGKELALTLPSAYPLGGKNEIVREIWDTARPTREQGVLKNWKNTIDIFGPSFIVPILRKIYGKRIHKKNVNSKLRKDLQLSWPILDINNFNEIFRGF